MVEDSKETPEFLHGNEHGSGHSPTDEYEALLQEAGKAGALPYWVDGLDSQGRVSAAVRVLNELLRIGIVLGFDHPPSPKERIALFASDGAPFAKFANRVMYFFVMGLVDWTIKNELEIIDSIHSDFLLSPTKSFADPDVAEKCATLRLSAQPIKQVGGATEQKFLSSVSALYSLLVHSTVLSRIRREFGHAHLAEIAAKFKAETEVQLEDSKAVVLGVLGSVPMKMSPQFASLLGLFHIAWGDIELITDFAIGKFLNVTFEQAHLLTAGVLFGRKARLLVDLVKRSDHPKKAEILGPFNDIRGNSMRDIFAHGYIASGKKAVAFLDRSSGGEFRAKEHPFTMDAFRAHVVKLKENGERFQAALGVTTDELDAFAQAALSPARKPKESPTHGQA
jgi:hypothetical protein